MAEESFPVYRDNQFLGSWTSEGIRRDVESGVLAASDMVEWGSRRLPVIRFEKLYEPRGHAMAKAAIILPALAVALGAVILFIAYLIRGTAGGVGRLLESLGF